MVRLDVFPLAETVRWRGKLLPRYAWYMLSGAVCDVGQFVLYKTLWSSFGLPTFSWTAAYVLSIAMRQESHKVFVFGHYEGTWYKNLWRFYCVYFLTVATSMPVNLLLVRLMGCLPTQLLDLGIAESTYVRGARGADLARRAHARAIRARTSPARPSSRAAAVRTGLLWHDHLYRPFQLPAAQGQLATGASCASARACVRTWAPLKPVARSLTSPRRALPGRRIPSRARR